ncbi:S8/S53 family peptidase [Actinoplanes sp. LDG1-06]|uniref:S8/S53 family peptidase n=1 Tax=Paractinoplanes ovalisporus TaxID=2810368 RepID=A0ABS2AUF2_9ACTN|nr:S8/S53 family peptidase [Actinoplanes ovalisporus]MBM2623503.1 S8/S53 family peptidase [Actinoplanes ovalisporus]
MPGKRRKPDGHPPAYPDPSGSRQEAQVAAIMRHYGHCVEPGPADWREVGIHYFVRREVLLIPIEHSRKARRKLARMPGVDAVERLRPDPDAPEDGTISYGLEWVRLKPGTSVHAALAWLADAMPEIPEGEWGPEYLVDLAPNGTGTKCQGDEPTPVHPGTPPDPPVSCDPRAGLGIKVVVLDTGLDDQALGFPWMAGVTGDPDPGIGNRQPLAQYAGHGTFIAGLIRCVAPAAEVVVRAAFPPPGSEYATTPLGFSFEKQMVEAMEQTLAVDFPDVINLSAGTFVAPGGRLHYLNRFYERRWRRQKGTALVAAAGNDGWRDPFHPAAEKWAVAAGSLAANLRGRAWFSNHGGWVDAYAPGEGLVNVFPTGRLDYMEPPRIGNHANFTGLARWSGTSFATGVITGLVAARMSRTGENGPDAASAVIAKARKAAIPGVGAVALPWLG